MVTARTWCRVGSEKYSRPAASSSASCPALLTAVPKVPRASAVPLAGRPLVVSLPLPATSHTARLPLGST